jgi:hypothetical protein
MIDATSYDINNLDIDCKILLFTSLKSPLENLPSSLTHIWLKKQYICDVNIKLPFVCETVYFKVFYILKKIMHVISFICLQINGCTLFDIYCKIIEKYYY